jgi:hypothetical protein
MLGFVLIACGHVVCSDGKKVAAPQDKAATSTSASSSSEASDSEDSDSSDAASASSSDDGASLPFSCARTLPSQCCWSPVPCAC